MNRIGNNNDLYNYNIASNGYHDIQHKMYRCSLFFKDFLKFFIRKICNNERYFSFRDSDIHLAVSKEQFAIIISKYFIEYCNYNNEETEINIDSIISDFMVKVQRDVSGVLKYYRQTNPRSHTNESLSDIKALTFKGQDKYVKIDAKAETSQNKEIYLLNPELVSLVLNYLLKLINYGNTKEFTTNSKIPYFF